MRRHRATRALYAPLENTAPRDPAAARCAPKENTSLTIPLPRSTTIRSTIVKRVLPADIPRPRESSARYARPVSTYSTTTTAPNARRGGTLPSRWRTNVKNVERVFRPTVWRSARQAAPRATPASEQLPSPSTARLATRARTRAAGRRIARYAARDSFRVSPNRRFARRARVGRCSHWRGRACVRPATQGSIKRLRGRALATFAMGASTAVVRAH